MRPTASLALGAVIATLGVARGDAGPAQGQAQPQADVPVVSELPFRVIPTGGNKRVVEVGARAAATVRAPIRPAAPDVLDATLVWYPVWLVKGCRTRQTFPLELGEVEERTAADGSITYVMLGVPRDHIALVPRSDRPVAIAFFPVEVSCPASFAALRDQPWTPPRPPQLGQADRILKTTAVTVARRFEETGGLLAPERAQKVDFSRFMVVAMPWLLRAEPHAVELPPGRVVPVSFAVLHVPITSYRCEAAWPARTPEPVAPTEIMRDGRDEIAARFEIPSGGPVVIESHYVVAKDPLCDQVWQPRVARSLDELGPTRLGPDVHIDFDRYMLVRLGYTPLEVDQLPPAPPVPPAVEGGALAVTFDLPWADVVVTDCEGSPHPCDPVRVIQHRVDVDWTALSQVYLVPKSTRPVVVRFRKVAPRTSARVDQLGGHIP
jgi:hypothetical protein